LFRTPLHDIANAGALLKFRHKKDPLDISRLLISAGGAGEMLIGDLDVLTHFFGPKNLFHYLQQQLYPPYQQFPLSERLQVAEQLSLGVWHNIPFLIKLSLGDEGINSEVLEWTNNRCQTFLHRLCEQMASISARKVFPRKDHLHVELYDEDLDEGYITKLGDGALVPWRDLAIKFIIAGAAVSAVDVSGRTPLCTLIDSYHAGSRMQYKKMLDRLIQILEDWILNLFKNGIDLQHYGEREKALRAQSTVAGRLPNLNGYTRSSFPQPVSFELTAFSFGPHPNDWHFWFADPSDLFAGEFWEMLEKDDNVECNLLMPGGWVT
jgi:hypothetical protein